MSDSDSHIGWLFLEPEHVPARWQDRSRPLIAVPLLPDEADGLVTEERARLEPVDTRMLSLLADGRSSAEIATILRISPRSVQRRLSALRKRLGVEHNAKLISSLARRGF